MKKLQLGENSVRFLAWCLLLLFGTAGLRCGSFTFVHHFLFGIAKSELRSPLVSKTR